VKLKEDMTVGIDVKEAVRLAKAFAADLLAAEKISHLGLEAVERSEDGRDWLVTLGFAKRFRRPPVTVIEEMLPRQPEREYKVFQVDGESGEVVAMKVFGK
jgi:hypothetical protein